MVSRRIALGLFLALSTALRAQQPSATPEPATITFASLPNAPTQQLAMVNGRPYVRPTPKDQFKDYLEDSYGVPAMSRSFVRSLYSQARGKPDGWGSDWPGYGQRFGSAVAVTAINGNTRYLMETIFHEDMRYYPCHKCSAKKKLANALLAEFTARHDTDGHRFFTLTPLISDFPGPIIANSFWYPSGRSPYDGLIAVRTVAATRIGGHLFKEFLQDRYKWLNFKGDR